MEYVIRLPLHGSIEVRVNAESEEVAVNRAAQVAQAFVRQEIVDQRPADPSVGYFTLNVAAYSKAEVLR